MAELEPDPSDGELPVAPDALVESVAPVEAAKRIASLDVIRGLALLGILTMNIPFFAFTGASYFQPNIAGGFEGLDYATWLVSHFLFEVKMMTLFSTLFGVGVLLFIEKARAKTGHAAGLHYRRMLWLLAIGMIHAYVIWEGDILVMYAMCGMIAYPLHRLQPKWLITIAAALLCVPLVLNTVQSYWFGELRDGAEQSAALIEAGEPVPEDVAELAKAWLGEYDEETGELIKEGMVQGFYPGPEQVAEEHEAVLGSFTDRLKYRASDVLFMQVFILLTWGVWRVVALMAMGMALYKWGVFAGSRSMRFYLTLAIGGFALGWTIIAPGVGVLLAMDFDTILMFRYGFAFNYVGSLAVALGWIGLLMAICKAGALTIVRSALANVGRMAFTNYLMQSLICGTIFFGWGFGQFGALSRSELVPIVLGIWAFQIVFSALWLRRFRFGPMEWAWRSLTYWRRQPMSA